MKIRNGFISNSSSSSFIIGHYNTKPNKTDLIKYFKVPANSPLYFLVEQIAEYLVSEMTKDNLVTQKSLVEEFCGDIHKMSQAQMIHEIVSNFPNSAKKYISKVFTDNNFSLYLCSAADDNGYIENLICEMEINIVTDNLVIIKEAGY